MIFVYPFVLFTSVLTMIPAGSPKDMIILRHPHLKSETHHNCEGDSPTTNSSSKKANGKNGMNGVVSQQAFRQPGRAHRNAAAIK
jgi:hypothetical protein